MQTPLNTPGTVTTGPRAGWSVRVTHDPDDTGGYFIVWSEDCATEQPKVFDDWVISAPDVDAYFTELRENGEAVVWSSR